ncbi:glycosyltransferase [Psychrobacter pocilloporae]|uniref:Glycosyltransferase family 4 protein n=1 Tax=Psychrobacter pocilloporae TaxID=1775882 RepID=A0ABT6IR46_9GAMM|nr:glycosyltransferase [Psychrobacter pocilloporae]MDH4904306.1 glycosyltransferase family 4 protein [Psychrobacter pocilloporae]
MNKPIHILIIPSWYPHTTGDIGGSFFREQAHALRKAGNKVGVIYPQVKSIKDIKRVCLQPHGREYINDNGLHTYKFHYLAIPKLHRIQRKRWVSHGLKLFENYTAKFGIPDIIHVHSLKPAGYLALEIKNKYQIPYVVTEHSTAFARGLIQENEIKNLEKIVSAADYNIAVSEPFSNLLNSFFGLETWNYIPNIVNNDFLNANIEEPKETFKYLSISLLTEKKAVDNLITAFSDITNKIPNAVLHIGGDGLEKVNLQKLVSELNLESKVVFLGSLSRERVKLEMANSSVFVLPSRYETFGVVLVEALALGKPVIATKCGGPESIVNEKVGKLVKVDDISELSKAMLDTYLSYNKYNSNDIREYCIDNFSEEAVTSKLGNVYQSVLSGSN